MKCTAGPVTTALLAACFAFPATAGTSTPPATPAESTAQPATIEILHLDATAFDPELVEVAIHLPSG